jgi:hypothetical protein
MLAFLAGRLLDPGGPSGRIDILAPPVLGILAWNLAVYLTLIGRRIVAQRRSVKRAPHPLRAALARAATRLPRLRERGTGKAGPAMAAFVRDWVAQAAPLYAARAARILPLGAASLALGVITGLYVRGLALEYRASWQSTFLDATQVHALLAAHLAPGAALTGLAVPDLQHVAAMRTNQLAGGENAARWVHLYAATVLLVVILPRLVLGLVDGLVERRRVRALRPDLDAPYFRRLLRDFTAEPLEVAVVPYSYSLAPLAQDQLRRIAARAFGQGTRVALLPAVRYGGEDALAPDAVPAGSDAIVALFNVLATPEAESHGRFVAALRATGAREVVALVDDAGFHARWPGETRRLAERHASWQEVLDAQGVPAVFVDLATPDLAAAEAALGRAIGQPEA